MICHFFLKQNAFELINFDTLLKTFQHDRVTNFLVSHSIKYVYFNSFNLKFSSK